MENLRTVVVNAEIHAAQNSHPARYRIYINNDLFTERTWYWHQDEFLDERLVCHLPVGPHSISIECINGSFEMRNIRLNGHSTNLPPGTSLPFVVDAGSPLIA